MNNFKLFLTTKGNVDEIANRLRKIADAIEQARGEHEIEVLSDANDLQWDIEKTQFAVSYEGYDKDS